MLYFFCKFLVKDFDVSTCASFFVVRLHLNRVYLKDLRLLHSMDFQANDCSGTARFSGKGQYYLRTLISSTEKLNK